MKKITKHEKIRKHHIRGICYIIVATAIIILAFTASSTNSNTFSDFLPIMEEATTAVPTEKTVNVVTIYLDFSEYNTTTTVAETTEAEEVTTEATTEVVTTEVSTDVTTEVSTDGTTEMSITTTAEAVIVAPATTTSQWTWEDEDEYFWEDNSSWDDDDSYSWEDDYSSEDEYSWEDDSPSWEDDYSWSSQQQAPSWGYSVTLYTYAGGGNAWENIKLACNTINGIYIPAYGSFSWMADVGMCNDYPYLPAGVFIGNEKGTGIGGGICFPSTTLMQAAESAGMWITEKHPHTMEVIYNPRPDPDVVGWAAYEAALSREAAIDTDCGVDMKFYNPYGYGFTIYATCDQWSGSCTMTLVPD